MLAVVLFMYALTAKRKIIIGIQIISGAVLSVSVTANVKVHEKMRKKARGFSQVNKDSKQTIINKKH